MTCVSCSMRGDISVVVPFYNRSRYLTRLIRSVKNQTLIPKRLFIIDNGSNIEEAEEAWRVITGMSQEANVEIIFLSTLKIGNANYARNLGLFLSDTEFVAFLDSDDWWEPEHLADSIAVLRSSCESAVYGGAIVHKRKRKIEYSSDVKRYETPFDFLFVEKEVAQTSSYVVKKADLVHVGWDEKLKRHQDYDFFLSVHYFTSGWAFKNIPSSNIDWSESSIGRVNFRSMIKFLLKWNHYFGDNAKKEYFLDQMACCYRQAAHPIYYRYYRKQLSCLPRSYGCMTIVRASKCYLFFRNAVSSGLRVLLAMVPPRLVGSE